MLQNIISSDDRPVKTWTLKQLESYAQKRSQEINSFGRRTIVQTWLFGESLFLIREIQKKNHKWMDWLKTQPFSVSTAATAVKFYERLTFEELESFDGITVSDLKAMLNIIKSPPPQRRSNTPTPAQPTNDVALKVMNGQEEADQSAEVGQSNNVTTTEAPEPHVNRRNGRKTDEPVVGPSLSVSEVLGQALNLVLEVEKQGVTPDCSDLLNQLAAKVATLIQTVNVQTS
jgi:hypothetical protein